MHTARTTPTDFSVKYPGVFTFSRQTGTISFLRSWWFTGGDHEAGNSPRYVFGSLGKENRP
jgi:hypothetical protein